MLEEFVDAGKARFVYRHLAFLSVESVDAARGTECADAQGRFWDFHDILYENSAGAGAGAFTPTNLVRYARVLGLDTAAFSECLDSKRYDSRIENDRTAAESLGVRSTPTVLINGKPIVGLQSYGVYRQAILEALAAGQ